MHPISGFPTTRTATTRAATTRTERSFPLFLLGSHPYPFPLHLYRLDSMTRAPCPRPRRHDAMTPHRRARTDSTAHVSTNGSARVEVVSFPLSSYHLSHASFLYVSSAVKCGAVQCDAVQTHHTLTHNPPPPPLAFAALLSDSHPTLSPPQLCNPTIPQSYNSTIPLSHNSRETRNAETQPPAHYVDPSSEGGSLLGPWVGLLLLLPYLPLPPSLLPLSSPRTFPILPLPLLPRAHLKLGPKLLLLLFHLHFFIINFLNF